MRPDLTPRQRDALETLARGRATTWPAAPGVETVEIQPAIALVQLGLATSHVEQESGRAWFSITLAGRRWLTTDGGRVSLTVGRPGTGVQGFYGRQGGS